MQEEIIDNTMTKKALKTKYIKDLQKIAARLGCKLEVNFINIKPEIGDGGMD